MKFLAAPLPPALCYIWGDKLWKHILLNQRISLSGVGRRWLKVQTCKEMCTKKFSLKFIGGQASPDTLSKNQDWCERTFTIMFALMSACLFAILFFARYMALQFYWGTCVQVTICADIGSKDPCQSFSHFLYKE
jgi:hypothetical protein